MMGNLRRRTSASSGWRLRLFTAVFLVGSIAARYQIAYASPLPPITLVEGEVPPQASDPKCKIVATDWTWFSDHLATTIDYVVEAAPGRNYEIATGLFLFGMPLGRTRHEAGKSEVTAYGAGALYVRFTDGGPPAIVCAAQGDLTEINFPEFSF